MLDEIYDRDKDLTEEDYYDALLFILGDAYPDLSDEELEDMMEDVLDRIPEQYVETVLGTIGNVGKSIGSGALDFSYKHPELVQGAAMTTGTLIAGPAGGKIGYEAGKMITKKAGGQVLPETGKTLAIMQNPQAQAALTRVALGVGNGTAPFHQGGNVNLVPVAIYLRALIVSAQAALKELDSNNIIPAAAYAELMPYSYDVDMQAAWLAEQLVQ